MVLVTGGSGFVGRYTVRELLKRQEEIIVLTRYPEKYQKVADEDVWKASLNDLSPVCEKLKDMRISTCIHLAWEGIPDYSYDTSETNLRYGLNVLKLCKECNIKKLIITGSCWEYKNPEGKCHTYDEIDYANSFKAAKNSLHMMAHSFCDENGIDLNWLRLFYVYGPGQRLGSLIPYIISSFKEGKQPELNGACNKNDFVYVEDVAKAITKCVGDNKYPEVLNVGSGHTTQVLDIVKIVADQYGLNIDTSIYPQCKGTNFCSDPKEMLEQYGWKAETSIEEGIRKMIKNDRERYIND